MKKIHFTSGFEINGVLYGWHKLKLYRLPQMCGTYDLPLAEAGKWKTPEGKALGYYVARKKKSFAQISSMTKEIDIEVTVYSVEG